MTNADAAGRRPPRVLIVDDDPDAVEFLAGRCSRMGLTVLTAADGVQALAIARQSPPDIMIVDVHMPELDGLSLCSRMIDPQYIGIDIIVTSGYSDHAAEERCKRFGATYVHKGPALWPTVQAALTQMFPGLTIESRDSAAATAPKDRKRPLVLVIDDDPDIGKFLITRLRKRGVDVRFATDAKQGYDIAVRERPAVIISDCYMPIANINFLLWRLRRTAGMRDLPVFAMSAAKLGHRAAAQLMNGQFGRRGVERLFKKPLDVDEMLTALGRYCALNDEAPDTGEASRRGSVAPGA
ncbi:MAG TPA: response regulator [Xanthobacteraceae bacterium]|nr:response regulator [Xanthobacteraceae bacterium]